MTRLLAQQRKLLVLSGVAAALVLFRSFVPTYYEGFYFDSDQAIVGLMARHVATFHRFPLYYYGLNYLMGVQAWLIAPFFWLFRSSVTVMRLPLVLLNLVVVCWLIAALAKRLRLLPAVAFVAVLPLIIPTPAMSSQLVEMAGASIEPFVYVLLLWQLRERPFLVRLPAGVWLFSPRVHDVRAAGMILVEALSGELWSTSNFQERGLDVRGFALIWLWWTICRMHQSGAALALQVSSLGGQMCFDTTLLRRAESVVLRALPAVFGGLRAPLVAWRMSSTLEIGRPIVWWVLAATLTAMVLRTIQVSWRRPRPTTDEGFGIYLTAIAVFTACAYPLSCNVVVRVRATAAVSPVHLASADRHFFDIHDAGAVSRAADNRRRACSDPRSRQSCRQRSTRSASAVRNPPESEHRMLVNYLTSHRIRYATAIYWDAYLLDFLSQERVIVASSDLVRIPEYQDEVDAHARIRQPGPHALLRLRHRRVLVHPATLTRVHCLPTTRIEKESGIIGPRPPRPAGAPAAASRRGAAVARTGRSSSRCDWSSDPMSASWHRPSSADSVRTSKVEGLRSFDDGHACRCPAR